MFALPPLAFVKNNESSAIIVLHVGRSLCGHDGIIHGGLLATVLDESLGRNVSGPSSRIVAPQGWADPLFSDLSRESPPGSAEYSLQNRGHRNAERPVQKAHKS